MRIRDPVLLYTCIMSITALFAFMAAVYTILSHFLRAHVYDNVAALLQRAENERKFVPFSFYRSLSILLFSKNFRRKVAQLYRVQSERTIRFCYQNLSFFFNYFHEKHKVHCMRSIWDFFERLVKDKLRILIFFLIVLNSYSVVNYGLKRLNSLNVLIHYF